MSCARSRAHSADPAGSRRQGPLPGRHDGLRGFAVVDEQVLKGAVEIYRALMAGEAGDIRTLRQESQLSERGTDAAITFLRELGLVGDEPGTESGLVPASPDSALADLLDGEAAILAWMTEALSEREEAIRTILAEFHTIHRGRRSNAPLEVITGQEAVAAILDEAPRMAKRAVAVIDPAPAGTDSELEHGLAGTRAALNRGVRMRMIHAQRLARTPRLAEYLRSMHATGAEVRFGRALPTSAVIIDSVSVILPVSRPHETPTAVLAHNHHLARFVDRIFENLWTDAMPLEVAGDIPGTAPTGLHEEALRLLASGLHDEAVARRLGVSLRTVGRLAADLMASLNAESRFAAGVAAARAGWLN